MAMDWWFLTLNIIRVIIAILILGVASYHDIKTRTVGNSFWVILGLIAISLFEIQIILEFGLDAFSHLILILPIIILFMSFLVCDYVLDLEKRKVNHSWLLLIAIGAFALVYLFQINSPDLKQNLNIIGPISLFLLFFIFMETIVNFADYRVYLRVLRSAKKSIKASVKKNAGEHEHDTSFSPDERFGWSLGLWLLLFYIIIFIMDNIVKITIVQSVGLVVLVFIPIILIFLYLKYHSSTAPSGQDEPEDDEDPDDLPISPQDSPYVQAVKYLNLILSMALIIIGFYLVIYYSVIIETEPIMTQTLSLLIWVLIFYGFYNLGIPRGGADTKALMALMLLFPLYPTIKGITFNTNFYSLINDFPTLGVDYVFPFAFTVLMNAALIMLIVIISLFIYNATKHNLKFPHAFLGYKLPINLVVKKFVWPMERLEEGKPRLMAIPGRDLDIPGEIKKFKKAGIRTIWVTPKIPFIVPMTISIVLTLIFGNLLFEIIL